jgi:hypothetical protein
MTSSGSRANCFWVPFCFRARKKKWSMSGFFGTLDLLEAEMGITNIFRHLLMHVVIKYFAFLNNLSRPAVAV